jgi:hypothetical protein
LLKFYKVIDNELHYWETWDKDDKTAIIHWGIVGQQGQDKEVKGGLFQPMLAYLYGGQETINTPSWSPDSKRIAFVSNSGVLNK